MKYLLLITLFLVLSSCKDSPKSAIQDINKTSKTQLLADQSHLGKELLEKECYTCHNPKTPHQELIAPPMTAIKRHYLNATSSRDQFVMEIMNWVKNPNKENSKMPGALNKFGIMPYQSFPEETISQIAEYLYDNEIEKPVWFQTHMGKGKGKGKGQGKGSGMEKCSGACMGKAKGKCKHMQQVAIDTLEKFKKLGRKYASASKAALGKKLMSAIAKNGPEGAVEFCNANALQITDSLSLTYGAKIRRVTDKPRNPLNQANKKELMHIANFKEKLVSGDEISPIMDLVDGQVNFYSPIITNAMCLQCHGKTEAQIAAPTLSKLDKLYPKDMAREYRENEVRGIWAISFKQTN
jgi:cytochrome c553